jgi:DNA-binding MarR family transcriptional regulator
MDIVSKFTKEITLVNLAIKQFLQCKLRENNIDLTFEMLQVLHCLWKKNGINQQEIANLTAKDKASVTYVLDNLVKRNYIYRQEGEDRRNKIIFLTPEGKGMKKQIDPWIKALNNTSKKGVSLDKLEELVVVMEKVRKNLAKV